MLNTEGSTSSEFWLVAIAIVGIIVLQLFDQLTEGAIAAIGAMVGIYTGGRSFVKGQKEKAKGEADHDKLAEEILRVMAQRESSPAVNINTVNEHPEKEPMRRPDPNAPPPPPIR